ncbi:hypothetical protein EYF80_009133 [Liparis tanakae]|uniref:Uncharacterized protein n=1 Tax=Liparis tanakae TaxID=230148 RepID=A0A4Z2IRX0_9TELE|nr:hypothetical protein EYF80_009133 [Liparis tanakae]
MKQQHPRTAGAHVHRHKPARAMDGQRTNRIITPRLDQRSSRECQQHNHHTQHCKDVTSTDEHKQEEATQHQYGLRHGDLESGCLLHYTSEPDVEEL